jgi:hypothetical protein
MAKKNPLKLIVFFDTNALYTQVASDLFRTDVRNLIKENSKHADLEISWHLPEVVIGERRFQMIEKARELLPNLQKMERLLGHTFGVGGDTLEIHVENTIKNEIKNHNIQIAKLDIGKVDWDAIIEKSVTRVPPFERGDKEKGFRDALIANTFYQTHQKSPTTPTVCLLAIVTSDEKLLQYIQSLTNNAKNIRALSNLDELESLINTLTSSVSEEFANELKEKANKLFFTKGDEKTLYYKEGINTRINRDFPDKIKKPLLLGQSIKHGTWWVNEPIFVKKTRQRVHWITSIQAEYEITHFEFKTTVPDAHGIGDINIPANSSTNIQSESRGFRSLGDAARRGILENFGNYVTDQKGREKFEVHWSVSITQSNKSLTKPTIDDIKYIGCTID